MRAIEFILEGGWDTTITQSTIVSPAVVKSALVIINKFTHDFNQWLHQKGLGPVEVGHTTGSSTYYDVDPEDKIYGDIDLQMVAPATEHETHSQFQGYWNQLTNEFVNATNPSYIHVDDAGKAGHPIVQLGPNQYVQVDFMWHRQATRDWGRYRVTPERGIKGLLTGNMFSVLGELLGMSIQHAGVQLKVRDGKQVAFAQRKDTKVITVTTNPKTFVLDILQYLKKDATIDTLLKQYSGINTDEVKISQLVNAVKGLAKSFEVNSMYGQGVLEGYTSAEDFINKFWTRYSEKAVNEVNSSKRDKANSPEAIARAEEDKRKVLQGLEMVKGLFVKQAIQEANYRCEGSNYIMNAGPELAKSLNVKQIDGFTVELDCIKCRKRIKAKKQLRTGKWKIYPHNRADQNITLPTNNTK